LLANRVLILVREVFVAVHSLIQDVFANSV